MQFRFPKWYLLVLLSALLISPCRVGSLTLIAIARGDDGDDSDSDSGDDSDSDSDSGNSNQHHHASSSSSSSSSSTLSKHAVSKGAIAGIVLGLLFLLLLLILFGCWCLRRRRARRQSAAAAAAVAAVPSMKEASSAPLLVQHPDALRPRSTANSPTETIPGGLYFSDSQGRRATQEMRNVAPGMHEGTPLPNPYDGDTPPQPPPRDDIYSPISPSSTVSRYTSYHGSTSQTSRRDSSAPSAWTHDDSDVALLSRGATQTSRLTTSSGLHEELSGYQKALEAHHRKDEEDAVHRESRIGEGSSVPVDPPPVYSASEGQ